MESSNINPDNRTYIFLSSNKKDIYKTNQLVKSHTQKKHE